MLIGIEDLPRVRQKHQGQRIAIRTGCFDLLHAEHVRALEFARECADILVAGVWPDRRVKERKGYERPIRPETDRAIVVGALAVVDYALVMPYETETLDPPMIHVVNQLQPDVFVVAEAQMGHPNDAQISLKGVEIVPDPTPAASFSTTSIIHTVLSRYSG